MIPTILGIIMVILCCMSVATKSKAREINRRIAERRREIMGLDRDEKA